MKKDYSHITLVCDRSGSMSSVRSDAEGSVNEFVRTQALVPGTATLLLVEFDASRGLATEELRDVPWYHIVHNGTVQSAPVYRLTPRGNTALLDAVGTAITETGEKLSALPEFERPEHVFFVVQTDGMENSSRDWTLDKLRELIKHQTEAYNWQFVFLGMGPDAFGQGSQMGFQHVTKSAHTGAAYAASYGNTSDAVRGMREHTVAHLGATDAEVDEHGNITPASN